MKIPVHYLPSIIERGFLQVPEVAKMYNFHPTADGWTGVLKCSTTGIEYRLDLNPIQSEKKVGLMYSDFEKEE